jgi:hypothetical protein
LLLLVDGCRFRSCGLVVPRHLSRQLTIACEANLLAYCDSTTSKYCIGSLIKLEPSPDPSPQHLHAGDPYSKRTIQEFNRPPGTPWHQSDTLTRDKRERYRIDLQRWALNQRDTHPVMGAALEARHNQKMEDGINQTERLACRTDTSPTGTLGCKTAFNNHKVDTSRIGTSICRTNHFLCRAHLHQTLD